MTNRADESAGVSYRDVEQAVRRMQRDHCVQLRFEISTPLVEGTQAVFWVHLISEPRLIAKATVKERIGVSRNWPHVDHRTMAGLMFWLTWEMDKRLEAATPLPAKQAALPWG